MLYLWLRLIVCNREVLGLIMGIIAIILNAYNYYKRKKKFLSVMAIRYVPRSILYALLQKKKILKLLWLSGMFPEVFYVH